MSFQRCNSPSCLPVQTVPLVYRWISPFYDVFAAFISSRARCQALRLSGIRSGISILDAGVGTGITFERFLQINHEGLNVGIDLSPSMLKHARNRANRFRNVDYILEVKDLTPLSYPRDYFDLVWCSYTMDIQPECTFRSILDEFRRVLKPGGRLVLVNTTYGERWYERGWCLLSSLHPAILGGSRSICAAPFCRNAEFVDIRRYYISQFGFPSEVVVCFKPVA